MYKCHVRPCGLAGLAGLVGLLNRPTQKSMTQLLLVVQKRFCVCNDSCSFYFHFKQTVLFCVKMTKYKKKWLKVFRKVFM